MKYPFRQLSLEERISRELAEARLTRLSAYSSLEYYKAIRNLAEARIKRLEDELQGLLEKDQI